MKLGEIIRKRRIELNLTQQELAEKMGYTSFTTISKIENGKNDITIETAKKFASILKVPISYIMGWEEPKKKKGV